MKVAIFKKKNKKVEDFETREWKNADIENFGRYTGWKNERFYLVAREKVDTILGTLDMEIEAGVTYIDTLLVAKTARGKGVGSVLIKKAEEIAKKKKSHKIYLETGKSWKAVDFYKKHDYKITGEHPMHSFRQNFVIFSKFL